MGGDPLHPGGGRSRALNWGALNVEGRRRAAVRLLVFLEELSVPLVVTARLLIAKIQHPMTDLAPRIDDLAGEARP
jgi:hypothetical protein